MSFLGVTKNVGKIEKSISINFLGVTKMWQNSKIHYLLAIHNFDLIFSFLKG
jgi:hypothetical protein